MENKVFEMLRKCKGCGELFPISEFKNKADHKGRYNIYCTACGGKTIPDPVEEKECVICKKVKPKKSFKKGKGAGRLPEVCLECKGTEAHKLYKLEQTREYNRQYREKNREQINERAKLSAQRSRTIKKKQK